MKRTTSVTWQNSQKTPKKKRTMSNSTLLPRTPSDITDEPQASFSNIRKLLHVSPDSSSLPDFQISNIDNLNSNFDNELFSDAIFNITGTIENIIETAECKILKLQKYTIKLIDNWRDIDFHKGMNISIFECECCTVAGGTFYGDEITICDGMLLMIDAKMISVTMLCESFTCLDKSLIKERIMDINFKYSHASIVVGIIMHAVIEKCILEQVYSLKFIVEAIKSEIQKRIKLLYACNVSTKDCMFECTRYIKNILRLKGNKIFSAVYDVEKRIVSHRYNLIGNIDAVLNCDGARIPLEIKTGKRADFRHKAQIIFYLMMLRDKYKNCKDYGVLLYVYDFEVHNLKLKHNEVKELIILRNKIAAYHFILKKNIICDNNFINAPASFKTNCSCLGIEYCRIIQDIFHEDGFKAQFLKEQYISINEEEAKQKSTILIPAKFVDQTDNNLTIHFKSDQIETLLNYIEVYNECENRLCFGRITNIDGKVIKILLSSNISLCAYLNIFIGNTKNEMFYKTMRYSLLNIAYTNNLVDWNEIEKSKNNNQISHLNTLSDQNSYTIGSIKNEVLNSPSQSTEKYFELFSQKISQSPTAKNKIGIPEIFKHDFLQLNENQRSALFLALNCENYKIIHGFPGTGKSKVITLLIKIMCFLKKKVLLICYTNLAIDNILSKLTIKYYRALKDTNTFDSMEKLKEYLDGIELVAGTCYSFTDIIFLQRRFEMCIIDEASQQHFLLTLIPISICNKFVLVGDHLQLKPLTNSNSLLNISLFEYLSKKNVSELRVQYRMGDNIMKLSNYMFYDNKMKGIGKEGYIEFVQLKTLETQIKQVVDEIKGNIVILCYFNSTVYNLRKIVDCRIETIDRFQGSEADVVIVIFYPIIKNNIMCSRERLNVAMTRARKRLILVGDKVEMKKIGLFREMFNVLEKL